jgi:hypothetical protein
VGKILTLRGADLVDSIPPLHVGLQRELSFDFTGFNETAKIPTEGFIEGKVTSAALKLSLPLQVEKVVCLKQGLWISICAGTPSPQVSGPKAQPTALLKFANIARINETLDKALKQWVVVEDVGVKISQQAFTKLSRELPNKYNVTFASTTARGNIVSGKKDLKFLPDPSYSVRLKHDASLKGRVAIEDVQIKWDAKNGMGFVGKLTFNAWADLHGEGQWAFISISKNPTAKFSLKENFKLNLVLSPLATGDTEASLRFLGPRKANISVDVDIANFLDAHPKFSFDVPLKNLMTARVPRMITFEGVMRLPSGLKRYQMDLAAPRIEYDEVGALLASSARLVWSSEESPRAEKN